jgi:hypothetical protein
MNNPFFAGTIINSYLTLIIFWHSAIKVRVTMLMFDALCSIFSTPFSSSTYGMLKLLSSQPQGCRFRRASKPPFE